MASTSTEPPMTPAEVASFFNVTVSAVVQWAEKGKLACFRTPGGQRRFHREDVEAFRRKADESLAPASTPVSESEAS